MLIFSELLQLILLTLRRSLPFLATEFFEDSLPDILHCTVRAVGFDSLNVQCIFFTIYSQFAKVCAYPTVSNPLRIFTRFNLSLLFIYLSS